MALDTRDIQYFENYRHPDNFGRLLGYDVVSFDRARREAVVNLTARTEHLSPSGKVHGGVISALLDYACGIAVCTTLDAKDVCSTVELKVNYFRPVLNGARLSARARVVFRGNRLCALSAELFADDDQEPCGMATATYNISRLDK